MFSFSCYNEPLGDDIIYKRISQARDKLSNANISINTNGDFVDEKAIERLVESGLSRLSIQVYVPEKVESYGEQIERRDRHIKRILKRIPNIGEFEVSINRDDWYLALLNYKGMNIRLQWRDFSVNGTNRGHLDVSGEYLRTSPCRMPFGTVHIDYDGSVMPCCNLRSDEETNRDSVLGVVDETKDSIFRIYSSNRAAMFRYAMTGFEQKKSPCHDCSFQPIDDIELNRKIESTILGSLEYIG